MLNKETSRSTMFSQKLRNCWKNDGKQNKLTFTLEKRHLFAKISGDFGEPISNCARKSEECAKLIYTLFGRNIFTVSILFLQPTFIVSRQMALYSE